TGSRREAANCWRQEEQARHSTGWGCQPTARQYLHEPLPQALASIRTWRGLPCSRRCLCRRLRHPEALAWTKAVMTKLGLTINESKTSLKDARRERFDFLGYSFGRHYPYKCKPGVRQHMNASPSKKSVQRLKDKVRELLVPSNVDPWPEVREDL